MISVEVALQLVLAEARCGRSERVPLGQALARVLAEDVVSDVDSPPHDKSIVDGFAVRAADLASGVAELDVIEEIMAGMTPTRAIGPGQTSRIMTGAPLPAGAEGVVMVERSTMFGARRVRLEEARFQTSQNVVRRAAAMKAGEVVLNSGRVLRPIEIGLLAEVGRAEIDVYAPPSVAVLSTGNELVPLHQAPSAGQIRNSNGPMLTAAVLQAGGQPCDLGIARDEPDALSEKIRAGLECDILLVSGGVSMGDLDLAPGIFRALAIEQVFHKIRLKPGKPLWFGVRRGERKTLVFGLPGNPVSSYVCFQLFVRPAMAWMQGRQDVAPIRQRGRLANAFRQRGERETFTPATITWSEDGCAVKTLPSQGSGDLRAVTIANALAYFPAGDREYAVGEEVSFITLE